MVKNYEFKVIPPKILFKCGRLMKQPEGFHTCSSRSSDIKSELYPLQLFKYEKLLLIRMIKETEIRILIVKRNHRNKSNKSEK